MVSNIFYPALSTELDAINLPEELNFIQNGIESLLNDIYLKEYQYVKSNSGDSLSYYLVLKIYKRIGIDIPGTGLSILLNPARNIDPDPNSTDIPISINIQYEILKYINDFSLETFSASPIAFFNLILEILDLLENEFIDHSIFLFTQSNSVDEFVDAINAKYPTSTISYPINTVREDAINEVISSIQTTAVITDSVHEVVFYSIIENDSSVEVTKDNLNRAFTYFIGPDPIGKVLKLFLPKISAGISLRPALEIPRNVLQPMFEISPGEYELEADESKRTRLDFDLGEFTFSTEGGIGYESEVGVTFDPDYPVAMIGNSGIIIGFSNAKLDLSKNTNISEATADGRPNDFIGIYVADSTIILPNKWFKDTSPPSSGPSLVGSHLLIGTGGLSGKIGFDAAGTLTKKLGEFEIELDSFDITFHQNSIIDSNIHGQVKINGFKDGSGNDALIEVDVSLETNGDFHVSATDASGIPLLQIPDILKINLTGLGLGREEEHFYVEVAGTIDFLVEVPVLGDILPKGIKVKRLRIWDNGEMEFEGGLTILPQPHTIELGPVKLTISAITLGKATIGSTKYTVFGFDGGINVNPGGIDVRANGVQLYFNPNDSSDFFIRIQGIAIDIMIPGTASRESAAVLLKGLLSVTNPSNSNTNADIEYAGAITVELPRLHMGGTAAMRLNPTRPSFVVDLGLEIPTPILLGSSGLGIYGFRGLVGNNYVASKIKAGLTEEDGWYDWYKADPKYQVDVNTKFNQEKGFSLGAGVSLATVADSGKAFSSRLFFMISMPETLIFEGQAGILRSRIGLDSPDEPPFFAFLALTSTSVEAAMGAHYQLPETSGIIANINGQLEIGFFFGNSTAWYLNLGRETPLDRRIQVKLFSLFKTYFYLMISNAGIRVGAGATWQMSKKIGPVKIELGASLDASGRISFVAPKRIGGSIALSGYARIRIWRFKFGFAVGAGLAAEGPMPTIVKGYFYIEIKIPFKKFKITVSLTWILDSTTAFVPITLMEQTTGKEPVKALNIMTKETFKVFSGTLSSSNIQTIPHPDDWSGDTDDYSIPLDSYIDIEFTRPVAPDLRSSPSSVANPNRDHLLKIGGANSQQLKNSESVPPIQALSVPKNHRFYIRDLRVLCLDDTTWVPYDMYTALTPYIDLYQISPTILDNLKFGFWQLQEAKKTNKIRMLAQDPFSYMIQGDPSGLTPEELGLLTDNIFCVPEPITQSCMNFDSNELTFSKIVEGDKKKYKKLWFAPIGVDAYVVKHSLSTFNQALQFSHNGSLEIILPEKCGEACLRLSTDADSVTIEYYRKIETGTDPNGLPIYAWDLVNNETVLAGDLGSSFCFSASVDDSTSDESFERLLITTGSCIITEPICDSEPTDYAARLAGFLNLLANNSMLTTDFEIYPAYNTLLNGYFHNSVLYNFDLTNTVINYKVNNSIGYLDVTIYDNHGFTCSFRLNYPEPTFDFSIITAIAELNPVQTNPQPGGNYDFIVKGTFGESVFVFTGMSCYPLLMCRECSTFIHEVCYLSRKDQLSNSNLPIEDDLELDLESIQTTINNNIIPIWRPNTKYAIYIHAQDTVPEVSTAANTGANQYYYYCFQTKGPIGHFHQIEPTTGDVSWRSDYQTLKDNDRESEFKLARLQHYIDFSRSYPNADGDILNAKPLFCLNPKLRMFFLQPYMYAMFSDWDAYQGQDPITGSIDVIIRDPANPDDETGSQIWLTGVPRAITQNMNVINNFNSADPCLSLSSNLNPTSTASNIELELKPSKLYTAILNNKFNDVNHEVHRYTFQTSRYKNFDEQLKSYVLTQDGSGNPVEIARYFIAREFDSFQIDLAHQILTNDFINGEDVSSQYQTRYERILDGALKLGALPPPVTTDFIVLTDSTTDNILGIIIRNPEPFNHPKLAEEMPTATAGNIKTLAAYTIVSESASPLNVYLSKDKSRAFVTNEDMNIEELDLQFVFNYYEITDNGDDYTKESITVDLSIPS